VLDDTGARQAVEHLLAHGHRRIARVTDPEDVYTARERLAGLAAAGIDPNPVLLRSDKSDATRMEGIVAQLLESPARRRPSALFAADSRMPIGALCAAAVREPYLVGFDHFALANVLAVRPAPAPRRGDASSAACAPSGGDAAPPRGARVATGLVHRGSGERGA
jgi:LacI family transcriptional regulator